mmetsp:Transcript_23370/g.54338  ORF Transcript_23370/g.54338 Transcript_23370/m.54338 type:complete len:284 (+) Transcript_23370:110-961(+)|eukprot:CAMPEP_0178379378 /NCGR_PEP_ID=MMETSP0689_2-20121128/4912_1 /TAXON_ID=160604 /ORGANISM="Amphidinium massartii, Strain CS-259" /LENGTH=283 /DNA_ID=CAMNT_0019999479 /DNA_START=45 /DNA_END=896 /DNA_ORIENTATION=+
MRLLRGGTRSKWKAVAFAAVCIVPPCVHLLARAVTSGGRECWRGRVSINAKSYISAQRVPGLPDLDGSLGLVCHSVRSGVVCELQFGGALAAPWAALCAVCFSGHGDGQLLSLDGAWGWEWGKELSKEHGAEQSPPGTEKNVKRVSLSVGSSRLYIDAECIAELDFEDSMHKVFALRIWRCSFEACNLQLVSDSVIAAGVVSPCGMDMAYGEERLVWAWRGAMGRVQPAVPRLSLEGRLPFQLAAWRRNPLSLSVWEPSGNADAQLCGASVTAPCGARWRLAV